MGFWNSESVSIETRSAPASLAATPRSFAFYVAHAVRSVRVIRGYNFGKSRFAKARAVRAGLASWPACAARALPRDFAGSTEFESLAAPSPALQRPTGLAIPWVSPRR